MTAPVAQSTVAIESQATALATASLAAQTAAASYIAQAGADEEVWYDTQAITDMARTAASLIDGFSVAVARQADAFAADAVATLSGRRFRPLGVRKTVGSAAERGVRTGITTAGLVGRAADSYRYQQSLIDKQFISDVQAGLDSPTELASPLDIAIGRVRTAAQLNNQLAMRLQSREVYTEAARRGLVAGYRRVLHAELSQEGSCGLCIAASTAVYRTDRLMPLHPGCHCLPVPLSLKMDPGQLINAADLGRFYDEAGGTSAAKLRETRYKVDSHGEVGPVLRPFGKPIRREDEARRDTNKARRPKTDAEKLRTLRARHVKLVEAVGRLDQAGIAPEPWKAARGVMDRRIARLERDMGKLVA